MRTTSEISGSMLNAPMFKSYLSGVPDEEDKKKNHEKILEEIIVENFPNMGKEIVTQVQETQSPIYDKFKEECTQTHINQIDKN